jgi:hypothetical protein
VPAALAIAALSGRALAAVAGASGLEPFAAPRGCAPPAVVHGSIVKASSPVLTGRLVRDGVPSVCGRPHTCPGVQNTTDTAVPPDPPNNLFAYQQFSFVNSSAETQCVKVEIDASACKQAVYSATYLGVFDPTDLCANVQGAMGFSTSGRYGYSFLVPAQTPYVVVNNTVGIVPPTSDCASYTMTVSSCGAVPRIAASWGAGAPSVRADAAGKASVMVPVTFTNTGGFAGSVNAATVMHAPDVSVVDGEPATVQARSGAAGAIVMPGGRVTQDVPLEFSGSPLQCRPRTYLVRDAPVMTADPYFCTGFIAPSPEVATGSVPPDALFSEDAFAFYSAPDVVATASVDTVSAATAFDVEACIGGEPQGPCLPGLSGDDDFVCTFPPPAFACPRFGDEAHAIPVDPDGDGIYYLRIDSGSGASNFAGATGDYRVTLDVSAGAVGACPMVPVLDTGANGFLTAPLPSAFDLGQSDVAVTASPVRIVVPAADAAACPTDLLAGKKLVLKGNERKSLTLKIKSPVDLSLDAADDPTLGGATLRVVSASFDDTYEMPAAGWKHALRWKAVVGYKYGDPKRLSGPISTVTIDAKGITVAGKGPALGHVLAASDPSPVRVVLTTGERRYCSTFGGATKLTGKKGKTFSAVDAPTPAGCAAE